MLRPFCSTVVRSVVASAAPSAVFSSSFGVAAAARRTAAALTFSSARRWFSNENAKEVLDAEVTSTRVSRKRAARVPRMTEPDFLELIRHTLLQLKGMIAAANSNPSSAPVVDDQRRLNFLTMLHLAESKLLHKKPRLPRVKSAAVEKSAEEFDEAVGGPDEAAAEEEEEEEYVFNIDYVKRRPGPLTVDGRAATILHFFNFFQSMFVPATVISTVPITFRSFDSFSVYERMILSDLLNFFQRVASVSMEQQQWLDKQRAKGIAQPVSDFIPCDFLFGHSMSTSKSDKSNSTVALPNLVQTMQLLSQSEQQQQAGGKYQVPKFEWDTTTKAEEQLSEAAESRLIATHDYFNFQCFMYTLYHLALSNNEVNIIDHLNQFHQFGGVQGLTEQLRATLSHICVVMGRWSPYYADSVGRAVKSTSNGSNVAVDIIHEGSVDTFVTISHTLSSLLQFMVSYVDTVRLVVTDDGKDDLIREEFRKNNPSLSAAELEQQVQSVFAMRQSNKTIAIATVNAWSEQLIPFLVSLRNMLTEDAKETQPLEEAFEGRYEHNACSVGSVHLLYSDFSDSLNMVLGSMQAYLEESGQVMVSKDAEETKRLEEIKSRQAGSKSN